MRILPGSLVIDGSLFASLKHEFYSAVSKEVAFIVEEPFVVKVACYNERVLVSFKQGSLVVDTDREDVIEKLLDIGACIVMEYAWAKSREITWKVREIPEWLREVALKAGFEVGEGGLGVLRELEVTGEEGRAELVKPWHPGLLGIEEGEPCLVSVRERREMGDLLAKCGRAPLIEVINENEVLVAPLKESWKLLPLIAYVSSVRRG